MAKWEGNGASSRPASSKSSDILVVQLVQNHSQNEMCRKKNRKMLVYTCKFHLSETFGLDSSHVLTILVMVTVWNHHSWSWLKSICIGMPTVPRKPGAGMPVSMGMPSGFISCACNTDPGTAQRSRHCSSPASPRAWACDDHVYPRPGLVAYWKISGFSLTSFTKFPLETQLQDTAHC